MCHFRICPVLRTYRVDVCTQASRPIKVKFTPESFQNVARNRDDDYGIHLTKSNRFSLALGTPFPLVFFIIKVSIGLEFSLFLSQVVEFFQLLKIWMQQHLARWVDQLFCQRISLQKPKNLWMMDGSIMRSISTPAIWYLSTGIYLIHETNGEFSFELH